MPVPLFRTGIPAIDSTVGGIVPNQLTLIAGDENSGKTWLALGFVCAALERDEQVHLLTDTPLSALCAQAAQYLGRDLAAHLRRGRLTVQTVEPHGPNPFPELSSILREGGGLCLVLDPIDALLSGAGKADAVARALVHELVALGATCLATTRTHGRRRSAAAKQVASRASAQFELVQNGADRALWVREALWSRREGEAFAIKLVSGVGAMPGHEVETPAAEPEPLNEELSAYLAQEEVSAVAAPQRADVGSDGAPAGSQIPGGSEQEARQDLDPVRAWLDDEASFAQAEEASQAALEADPEESVDPDVEADFQAPGAQPEPAASASGALLPLPPLALASAPTPDRLPAAIAVVDRAPRRLLFVLFTLVASGFLAWRASLLLDVEYPGYSSAFFAAEVLAMLAALWCYWLMSAPRRPAEPEPPVEGMTVDVLILTYNEELTLVRHTILAARDLDEPHSVWVCDDGRRPEVAAMCHEMGVGYITRENNEHYKAGNINHALARTRGELILILDADHVPRRTLLTRLMGYFRDPKVAHVQIPQLYYNVDSFQHSLTLRRASTWHESSVFHHGIMHGLARANATCFLGTGAVMRRSALAEIGGVATGNVTEDVLTGMRLHARGYSSVFVDEPLAALLAPDTALAYAQQRLRWAQGNLEILRTENPFLQRGLTWRQRLAYFNTFGFYLLSYVHLLVYLVPAVYLFTGIAPLSVNDPYNVAIVAAFTGLAILNYLAMARPHARLFRCECFKLLNLPINLRASLALVLPGGRAFKVTPKGFHIGLPLWVLIPIAAICLFNLAGLGYGVALMIRGDGHLDALLLASAWATFYGVASALTLAHTVSRRAAREPYAVPLSVAARLSTETGKPPAEARIRRLCHELAYVEVGRAEVAVGATVTLQLAVPAITLTGHVTAHGAPSGSSKLLRVELRTMAPPDWDALSHYLFEAANPAFLEGLIGGCTTRLAAVRGEQSRSVSHGIDFLALRSEIV